MGLCSNDDNEMKRRIDDHDSDDCSDDDYDDGHDKSETP